MWLRANLPAVPAFESDRVEAYLRLTSMEAEAQVFVRTLAADGLAAIELGDAGRALCRRVVAETEHYFDRAERVQDAWYRSSAVRRLATLPKVRRFLRLAYGREPFAFQTLNFRRGTEQDLHTDTIHFHSVPERFMCGVWIALEDIDPASGPLTYVPGSHRLPVMTMRMAGVNDPNPTFEDYGRCYVPALRRQIAASGLPERQAAPRMGTALVWAANLAHGGSPIADPGSTRRSLVTHFYFDDCLYYTPLTSDVEGGRYSLRMPPDVRSRRPRWPSLGGRPVAVSPRLVKEALLRDLRGNPHVA